MAKLAMSTVYKTTGSQKETALEKTTRISKVIKAEETKQRESKMRRLRHDRLASEGDA